MSTRFFQPVEFAGSVSVATWRSRYLVPEFPSAGAVVSRTTQGVPGALLGGWTAGGAANPSTTPIHGRRPGRALRCLWGSHGAGVATASLAPRTAARNISFALAVGGPGATGSGKGLFVPGPLCAGPVLGRVVDALEAAGGALEAQRRERLRRRRCCSGC